jgi:hypothetical protein
LQKDFENYTDFKSALTNLETNKMQTVLNRARGESPQGNRSAQPQTPANIPPALLSREATPYTGDTSVKGAVEQLQNEVPSAQPDLPEPTQEGSDQSQEGSDQYLGFIDKTSPLGNAVTPALDWFNTTRANNKRDMVRKSAESYRAIANQSNPLPLNTFRLKLIRNPQGLSELSAKELNKLRDLYGESLINQFIK